MATNGDYLSHEEETSIQIWKQEKAFMKDIFFANEERIQYLIKNMTQRQLKAILLILMFVAKKEIPLRKQAFSDMNKKKLKLLSEFSSKSFKDISEYSELELREKIQPFEKYLPILISPILKDE